VITTAGIVLCGGRSTRMGASKAHLAFGEETMLQRVVRLLGSVASPLVAVAAPGQSLPELPSTVTVVRDEREGQGPLEGLRVGLVALPREAAIAYATSCDVPLLVPAVVTRLADLADAHDIVVVETDGFAHPLCAVYRRTVLPHIEELLAADQRRPAFLFSRVRTRRVPSDELKDVDPGLLTLRNLNTPEEYQDALRAAGLGSG
jgi:molybdenum cofactor guanylyltransferase